MAVMGFWRKVSPVGAARDFARVWASNPVRWRVLAFSLTITGVVMYVAIPASQRITPPRPDIFYITSFEPDRTDAQIEESNLANQKKQDAIRAELAAREEFRKELYRELGRASGLDVDEMEREIARQEAADIAARTAARRAARPEAQATQGGGQVAGE